MENSKKELDLSIRWRIIGFLEAEKSQYEASSYFQIPQSTISRLWNKFKETKTVDDKKRTGRPRKIRTKMKNEIMMELEKPHTSCKNIATKIGISKTSVFYIAKELGYNFHYCEEIPKLSEENKMKRKAYCEQWKDKDLSKIIFSDESYFHIFRNTLGQWSKEKQIFVEKINPNKALMVWGAINWSGKSKLCIEEWGFKINQDSYIEILENYLVPFADLIYGKDEEWTFLQDNAPAHRGKKTTKYLEESQISLMGHPPYSPDLNPIEFIWRLLKDDVEKQSPQNLDELKNAIFKAWENIDQTQICGVISHLQNKMLEVFKNDGEFK